VTEHSKYSPVALFIYNRPEHVRRTVESLLANPEISETPVTVYCDGPKDEKDNKNVNKTRAIVRFLLPEAVLIKRKNNIGLANSIIKGVSEQCDKYGRTIVIEDDLILAPKAIQFMNKALDYYESKDKVMHISAYMYPVRESLPDTFFYRETSCWGWATWSRAWRLFEYRPHVIADYLKENDLIKEFGMSYSRYHWELLQAQCEGRIDSWFIRWYGSVFMNRGLALHPAKAMVKNAGFDGSGVHCSNTRNYEVELSNNIPSFSDDINEYDLAVRAMYEFRTRINKDLFRYRKRQFLKGIRFITGKFHNN